VDEEQPEVEPVWPNPPVDKGLWTVDTIPVTDHGHPTVRALGFSSDSKLVYATVRFHDYTVRILDRETGKELRRFDLGKETGYTVFLADGKRLVSTWGGALKVWDIASGECRQTNLALSYIPTGLIACPDSQRVIIWLESGEIQEWDLGTRKRTVAPVVGTPKNTVVVRGYLPDGNQVLLHQHGIGGRLWNPRTRAVTPLPDGFQNAWQIAWSADGKQAATIRQGWAIELNDPATGALLRRLPHFGLAGLIQFTPDGKRLLLAGNFRPPPDEERLDYEWPEDPRILLLWHIENGRLARTLAHPTPRPRGKQ
jgi:hypothetical protein